jgi:signal transduction histidine kinase
MAVSAATETATEGPIARAAWCPSAAAPAASARRLAAIYYASAQVGYAIRFAGSVAAIAWLPVGVAIAFLYLGGIRAGSGPGALIVVPLTYIVFPALIWAALRFGRRGATLAVAVATAVTVYDTSHYAGPLSSDSITRSVLSTQLYIVAAGLSSLALAAVVTERERYADRLGASRTRLVSAGEVARWRLERDLHDAAQQRLTALAVALGVAADASRDHPERGAVRHAGDDRAVAIAELRQLAHALHRACSPSSGSRARSATSPSAPPCRSGSSSSRAAASTRRPDSSFAEALTNAQRHARATTVRVRLFVALRSLRVIGADDGVGGAAEAPWSGLQGLRDRVEASGGWFDVSSPGRGGTTIRASIPLAAVGDDGAG